MTFQEEHVPPALLGFDTETTGLDVQKDRIVQGSLVGVDREGREVYRRDWLINPGILIPRQATKIHGITNEQVAEEGVSPAEAVEEIVGGLRAAVSAGIPLVVQNAPYDLSLLEWEARRHQVRSLSQRGEIAPVLDPVMLAKVAGVEGRHSLAALCQRFDVQNPRAHTAYADTVTTLAVLRKLLVLVELDNLSVEELHAAQLAIAVRKAQAWQEELRTTAPCTVVTPGWPLYGHTRVECECRGCGKLLSTEEVEQPCAECRSRYPVAAG